MTNKISKSILNISKIILYTLWILLGISVLSVINSYNSTHILNQYIVDSLLMIFVVNYIIQLMFDKLYLPYMENRL